MRQLSLLLVAGVVLCGLPVSTEAQQPTLPANSTNQFQPIIPAPEDANVPTPGSTAVDSTNTLPITTVQSTRPSYKPGQMVPATQYFDNQGTTGSYRVNRERAKDFQEAALQRARRKKLLQEQITSVPPQRMTYQSRLTPPVDQFEPTPEPATSPPLPPGATYENTGNDTPPPEPEINYIKMKGSRGPIVQKFRSGRSRKPVEMPSATVSETEIPTPVGNQAPTPPPPPLPDVPKPPTNVFRPEYLNPPPPVVEQPKPKPFAFLRKKPEPTPEPEPELPPEPPLAEATMVVDTPPEPAYPADSIPTFAPMTESPDLIDTPASAALVSPPEKKSLFSGWGRKKKPAQLPEVAEAPPSMPEPSAVPPPSFQPYQPPAPPKPTFKSIFRPNASAKKANSFSVIQGDEVYAMVDGKEVKLTAGTRVRVLREGTTRSLVVLYDNRQATIANGALTPETE